jgi:hypothetical protein
LTTYQTNHELEGLAEWNLLSPDTVAAELPQQLWQQKLFHRVNPKDVINWDPTVHTWVCLVGAAVYLMSK